MTSTDPPTSSSDEGIWHDVAALVDIPADFGLAVKAGSRGLALFKEEDDVYAVEDFCPHQGGLLSGGLIREGIVTCPLHAWQFRLTDGCNVDSGPGVQIFPTRVENGRVHICI